VSSEFDRLLRQSREALPVPDEPATERARRRTLATLRPRRRRARLLVLAGAMVATALALGVSAGSLNAPGVTAAREPALLGFVPEPGWVVLQPAPPQVEGQPTISVAANGPIHPDDAVDGLADPSGLPYSTLLTLAPHGIVIVAAMTPVAPLHYAPIPTNPEYVERELPLRFRDAAPVPIYGRQVRPDQPLATYQLRAEIHDVNVDVFVYFGTPTVTPSLRASAQRQLERLVIRSDTAPRQRPSAALAPRSETVVVTDRTYACRTVLRGGLYQVEAAAHAGVRIGNRWSKLPYAVVSSAWTGSLGQGTAPQSSLLWITAGTPAATTMAGDGYDSFPVATGGTLGVNASLCRRSTERVSLTFGELQGGRVGTKTRSVDCAAPRTVLVRVRATTRARLVLRPRARVFAVTDARIREARLAVRTPNGKLLAYAAVDESGGSRQYTARPGCAPEQ
jgi:hypothetical protein